MPQHLARPLAAATFAFLNKTLVPDLCPFTFPLPTLLPRSIPSSAGAAFPPGWGSPSRPTLSHPIPSRLVPSHPAPHPPHRATGPPKQGNHRHLPGADGLPAARLRWQSPRGSRREPHPPPQRARARRRVLAPEGAGWLQAQGPGAARSSREDMCRAAAESQLRHAHGVRLCPASRPSPGTDPDIPCSWLFVLSANCWHAAAAGCSRHPCPGGPAGGCSRPQHLAWAISLPSGALPGRMKARARPVCREVPRKHPHLCDPRGPHAGEPRGFGCPSLQHAAPSPPVAIPAPCCGALHGVRGIQPRASVALGTPGDTQQRTDPC